MTTPRIRTTFSRVTPESAEQGDTSSTGWIDDEGEDMTPDEFDVEDGVTTVDKAVKFLFDAGAYHASSSHFHVGCWYHTEYTCVDYHTAEEEERSYHLDGFTEAQQREIFNRIAGGR